MAAKFAVCSDELIQNLKEKSKNKTYCNKYQLLAKSVQNLGKTSWL